MTAMAAVILIGDLVREHEKTGQPFTHQELHDIVLAAREAYTSNAAKLIELLVKQLEIYES